MQNKKQIVIGGVVGVILLGTLGVFWYMYQSKINLTKNTPDIAKTQTSVDEVKETEKASVASPTDFIEIDGIKVGMVAPKDWGNLIVANDKETPQIYYRFSNRDDQKSDEPQFAKRFSTYIYDEHYLKESDTYHASSVILARFPEKESFIKEDVKTIDGPIGELFSIEQKKAGIDLIQKVYQDRRIELDSIATKTPEPIFWWGSERFHRIAPRYLENTAGDLRGVGYFEFYNSEEASTADLMGYKVVLVNPEKKVVVQMFFGLGDDKASSHFANENIDIASVDSAFQSLNMYDKGSELRWRDLKNKEEGLSDKERLVLDEVYYKKEISLAAEETKKSYTLLEHPEEYQAKEPELAAFMNQVDSLVKSIQIIGQ